MKALHLRPPSRVPGSAPDMFLADAPWKATSVPIAGATTMACFVARWNATLSPALARGGAGYVGGFLIGRAFRRTLTLAALSAGLVLTAIATVKATGWSDVDRGSLDSNVS